MAIHFYWSSGSPYCERVALALEHKGLSYESHLLNLDLWEHQSPQMLGLNFRGQVPVLRDGDYVVFESLAILYYLDRKYADPPIFGRTAEEGGVIMRVICEFESHAQPPLKQIVHSLLGPPQPQPQRGVAERLAEAMHRVAGEARSLEQRLARSDWVVGERFSAADMVIYPHVQLLVQALRRPEAHELATRFLPMHSNYPAIGRWLERVAALPGHQRIWPSPGH
jgi:glutathione S-transferase